MLQQATYLQVTMLAANLNYFAAEIDAGTGYLTRTPRIEIPKPPPFIGSRLTLNNINVSGSKIGAINTGTMRDLDASITVMQSQGESDLAAAVGKLTEAIIASNEIDDSLKNQIAEQLAFLSVQAATKAENRSVGVIKSVLAGIRDSISLAADSITIWDKVEPLFKAVLGV